MRLHRVNGLSNYRLQFTRTCPSRPLPQDSSKCPSYSLKKSYAYYFPSLSSPLFPRCTNQGPCPPLGHSPSSDKGVYGANCTQLLSKLWWLGDKTTDCPFLSPSFGLRWNNQPPCNIMQGVSSRPAATLLQSTLIGSRLISRTHGAMHNISSFSFL